MAIAHLAAVSLDTDDPAGLAAFYRQLLDLTVLWESDDFVALSGAGVVLTMQRVAEHRRPDWPAGAIPKQLHLEFSVADLDLAERQSAELGAVRAASQPAPDRWRVLLDPAGHPFCLTIVGPDDL